MSQRGIWVARHNGMIGSAVTRRLKEHGDLVLTVIRNDLDLRDQGAARGWLGAARERSASQR